MPERRCKEGSLAGKVEPPVRHDLYQQAVCSRVYLLQVHQVENACPCPWLWQIRQVHPHRTEASDPGGTAQVDEEGVG